MPPRRKRSVSSPKSGVGSSTNRSGLSGVGEGDNISSIPQGIGSISRSNTHLHPHDSETMMSPRHRHHQPPPTHSPHYQTPYEQPHHNQTYPPPPPESNVYHTHPPTFYHSTNAGQQYHNSPDEAHLPHPAAYPSRNRSPPANPPPNPHAPSHYNFANRAYAQQRDSGFNTFRVNPGPVPGPVAGGTSSVPPPVPLGVPSVLAPPSGQLQRQDENPFQFHPRVHPQPSTSTSTSTSATYAHLSPPLPPPREMETEYDIGSGNANGAGRWRSSQSRNRNGNGSPGPLTSDDDDDASYNPATAGGRSKAMVKYLIMKAKYRYVLDEHALLKDELESLKKEEHEQWRLKEGGVDEIIKSFGSDSDRFIHDRDQQAQQYQLHHDSMDQDLLNELDRERHAFHTRERSRNGGREREEHAIDVNNNERGRDHRHARPITTDRNRYGDAGLASPMSINIPLSLPESGRDHRHSERKRPRSSSGSRLETRLEPHTQSYHYPPHPYRRTPPPQSSAVEHESQPGPFPHPPQLRSSSPSFGLDRDVRQYVPRRSDTEIGPDGERDGPEAGYLPPRLQRQRSSFSTYGPGQASPPSQGQRPSQYQSPPPSITSLHQQQSPQLPHPILSPRSYRETAERSERHSIRREAEQVRQGQTFDYNYASVPSVSAHRPIDESRGLQEERRSITIGMRDAPSPRPPPSESSPAQSRMQGPDLEQDLDSHAQPKEERPSFEESAEGREDERVANTARPTSESRNIAAAQFKSRGRHSPSPPASGHATGQSHSENRADHRVSSFEPPAPPVQTKMEYGAMATPTQEEHDRNQSRGSSAIPPLSSQLQSSRPPNSTSSSRSVTSPKGPQPIHTLLPSQEDVVRSPPLQNPSPTSVANLNSNPPPSSQLDSRTTPLAPNSPNHLRSMSIPHSTGSPSSLEQRPTALRSPPTPQTRHSKYAYAYYPNESEGGAEDGDMTHKSANSVKYSNAEMKEGQGSASVESLGHNNGEVGREAGITTDADGVMDVD